MKFLISICFLISSLSLNAQSSITGLWIIGEENIKIEIIEEEGIYSARFHSSENSKLEVGKLFLKEFKKEKEKYKGKIYSIKKGKWYNATLEEKGDILEVKVKAGLMKKTLEWKRE